VNGNVLRPDDISDLLVARDQRFDLHPVREEARIAGVELVDDGGRRHLAEVLDGVRLENAGRSQAGLHEHHHEDGRRMLSRRLPDLRAVGSGRDLGRRLPPEPAPVAREYRRAAGDPEPDDGAGDPPERLAPRERRGLAHWPPDPGVRAARGARRAGESTPIRDPLSSLVLDSTADRLLPPHIPAASVGIGMGGGGHDREPLALSSPIFATSVYLARRLPGRARRYYDGRGAAAIDPHDAEVPRPRSAPQFLDAADPHHAAGGDRSSRFDLGPGSLRHSSGDTAPGPRSGALAAAG